jgi:hypothetical protein
VETTALSRGPTNGGFAVIPQSAGKRRNATLRPGFRRDDTH